jgi:hypothetical protein
MATVIDTTPEYDLREMALERAEAAGRAVSYADRRRLEQEALRLWAAARAAARAVRS